MVVLIRAGGGMNTLAPFLLIIAVTFGGLIITAHNAADFDPQIQGVTK